MTRRFFISIFSRALIASSKILLQSSCLFKLCAFIFASSCLTLTGSRCKMRFNESAASPILPEELSFGEILKEMAEDDGFEIDTLFSLNIALSPIGRCFSKSFMPFVTIALFSPSKGTMSAIVAMAAIGKSSSQALRPSRASLIL